jgi:signal transduction histidine kinase/CheY-like chemotaxis protein
MVDETDSRGDSDPLQGGDRGLEARKRFEAIVADAEEGVVVLEPNGVIGYANAAAEFLLGHGRSELVGEMFGLPAAPNDQPITVNVVSRDDTVRLVELRIEPLAAGPEGTLVLRLKDVTAYHRSVSSARDEVRRRDEFLAMLSHELRNPLAAIRSAAVLLGCDDLEPWSRREASTVLDRQFGHLTRILDDLLDVTRILRGKLAIAPERVELNQVLRDAAEAVAPRMTERGHRFRLDLPERKLWVWGDGTRLEQVVVNLLINAVKFTPHGGNITLSAEADAAGVEIRVSDDGPGIAEDLLPRIFEPFVQGAQTLERSDGGLGIGLMLVRTFIILHRGTVDVRPNEAGPGVSFTVRLPLLDADAEPTSHPAGASAERPLRILLVEDNGDVRRMLKLLLVAQGHEVVEAANGPDGLSAALERLPDVAFLDIGLPGMNGYELARRLRREIQGRLPRLVALTGYGTPEDVREAREAGFDDHMVKPVNFPALCKLLDTCRRDGAAPRDEGA